MTAWWSGSAVLLDFESDGPVPTEARAIQTAVVQIGPGYSLPTTWLIKPERAIDPGAIEVHGITTEYAAEHGDSRELAVFQIATALAAHAGGDVPVIAHNAVYDLTLLDREMRRLGIGSLGHEGGQVVVRMDGRQVGAFHVIDTIVLDRALDQYRKGPAEGGRNRLEEACRVYGVPMADGAAHDATADALAAGRLAWVFAKRCAMDPAGLRAIYADRKYPGNLARDFTNLGTLTLPQLHAWQQRQAKEQGEHLQDYFAEHPERDVDPADVSTDWPLIPVSATVDIAL
jgi:DNA polymerase III epsilon subunit-like protein